MLTKTMLEYLSEAAQKGASDVFIVAGEELCFKVHGLIEKQGGDRLMPDDAYLLVKQIYDIAGRADRFADFERDGDDDFSFSVRNIARFRVNTYKQRGSISAILRVVAFELPNRNALGLPPKVLELAQLKSGLVLVTGPAGSGKSTTLSCIIDQINSMRNCHIMTLEDPIEFLHRHNQSLISQREVSLDTDSYLKGLRAALRQAPDVILIGEMRDPETISIALTAAETGHLVFSTLHTLGAVNSVDRIIDVFPPAQQHQIRLQLSMVLQAVVSQQLLPTLDGKRAAAFEIMLANSAIRNMIRESKVHQMESVIFSNAAAGMQTMDASLAGLVKKGLISEEAAMIFGNNKESLQRMLRAQ